MTNLSSNITRHQIAEYLADCHNEDIEEYQDYDNWELIRMLQDSGWYEEFKEYTS